MGEQTGIAWTDSTINVWHGCHKVSQGCAHCYAEVSTPVRVKRAAGLEVWGANAARSETGSWLSDLRRWGRAVVRTANGGPWRVFGQSLSDTFEDRRDLDPLRARFFAAMTEWHSRSLTFQLLTKRPENVRGMVPPAWLTSWPAHVWIGATVEDQENAEKRIPHLLAVPAPVRFLSVEPQIGPVSLDRWFGLQPGNVWAECLCAEIHPDDRPCLTCDGRKSLGARSGISWVIQGGESGSKARPFDLAWMFDMRDQCAAAGVPWFPKQAGARPVYDGIPVEMSDSHGGDESEWPTGLRGCRAFPEART